MSLVSVLLMVIKRIVNNLNLMLAAVAGLIITVTLVSSIPLYSEGMSEALLHRQLTETTEQVQPKSSILLRHFEDQTAAQAPPTAPTTNTAASSGGGDATGSSGASATGSSSAASSAPVS